MHKYLLPFHKFFNRIVATSPRYGDAIFLSLFAILITLQPYYLHGKINLFELGLYLPGINSILDGGIPYRDFFHLRGPLELYIPAFFMSIFGEHISILSTYFYVGTIFTLIICVFVARELYRTRFVFFLMVPVLVGKTFPRVVFHFWGGMRFGMGALVVLFTIYFFKRKKNFWIFLSGVASSLALLTSIDMGFCSIVSVLATFVISLCLKLQERTIVFKSIRIYALGIISILLPYGIYLFFTQSLIPYFDCTYTVVTGFPKIFPMHFVSTSPDTLVEAFLGMSPFNRHFKRLTPAYCYLFLFSYFIFRIKKKKLQNKDLSLIMVAVYGLIIYILAFRSMDSGLWEMALQPDKILLFFMLEEAFLFLRIKKDDYLLLKKESLLGRLKRRNQLKIFGINFLIVAFIMSSIGYPIQRYNRRFIAFQYVRDLILQRDVSKLFPLANGQGRALAISRAEGMIVPSWQADDLEQIDKLIQENTKTGEPIFFFPELGAYHFIVDRPFVGRFPMITFSWFANDRWHNEFVEDLKESNPRFAILSKELIDAFENIYFKVPGNRRRFNEVRDYVDNNFRLISSTPSLHIYQRN